MPAIIEFLQAYDASVVKPKTFFKDIYFSDRQPKETQKLEIEYRKGGTLIAPFVSELIPGTEMPKSTHQSKYYTAPKVAPKKTFTAQELYLQKAFGETIYGGMSPDERKAKLIADALNTFEAQITRREELMCIQTLYNSEIIVKGEGVEDKITYGTPNRIPVATAWGATGANPIEDINAVLEDIASKTDLRPPVIMMDPVAFNLFINDPKVKDFLDVRNFHMGTIDPKELPSGAIYRGVLAPYNIPIVTYQTQYTEIDPATNILKTVKMIPEKTVLFAPNNNKLLYGSAADIEKGILVGERIVFEDIDRKANTQEVRTESRPLPVPFDIDAIQVLEV